MSLNSNFIKDVKEIACLENISITLIKIYNYECIYRKCREQA